MTMSHKWGIGKYFIFRCAGFPFELMEGLKFKATYSKINNFLKQHKHVRTPDTIEKAFREELYQKRIILQKISAGPAFQEAVFHQNQLVQDAYEAVKAFSKEALHKETRYRKERRRELLAYRYLQRFCTKNDTVSFFGPFCVGTFSNNNNVVIKKPDPRLIRTTKSYVSLPVIQGLIEDIINDNSVFGLLRPTPVPAVYIKGNHALRLVNSERIKLDAHAQKIITLSANGLSAEEIYLTFKSSCIRREAIFAKIRLLIRQGLLLSGLDINSKTQAPEAYLIRTLSKIPGIHRNANFAKLKKIALLRKRFEGGIFLKRETVS